MKQRINEVVFGNKTHAQWEFLKYKIQKFSTEFSKNEAKLRREILSRLEIKLTEFGISMTESMIKSTTE